ncbi:hypothetical protein [Nocardia thailandica]
MRAVVHVEVTGIQDFIFRSRTLLDTIGRSSLIEHLTGPAFAGSWPGGVARIVFAGAGRVSVAIDAGSVDEAWGAARAFARWFSRELAELSDAVNSVVHIDICADDAELAAAIVAAPQALRLARHATVPSLAGELPWGALLCAVTGSGAEGLDHRDGQVTPRANEVARGAEAGRDFHAEQELRLLPAGSGLGLPRLTDQLGRSVGESSQVAVVVADLNGVGELLRELTGADDGAAKLTRAAAALRALGIALGKHLVDTVIRSLIVDEDTGDPVVGGSPADLRFPLLRERTEDPDAGRWMLPVRPWVLAGDDLVLVCESRIAWSLATAVTGWLDAPAPADDPRSMLADLLGQRPTAGIGIAVVPVGYPLIRAHEIAETLCKNAKSRARQEDPDPVRHAVDWHRGPADPERVLTNRTRTDPRPFTHSAGEPTGLPVFLASWLGTEADHSLRGPVFQAHRGWCRGVLRDAALDGSPGAVDTAVAALDRARRVAGKDPVALPTDPPWSAGNALAALDLLDEHLELIPAEPGAAWTEVPTA